jgi:hypothetical protein
LRIKRAWGAEISTVSRTRRGILHATVHRTRDAV